MTRHGGAGRFKAGGVRDVEDTKYEGIGEDGFRVAAASYIV